MILAVCGMQLRLLCNLFDGMVAIEGGFKTKAGEIFNELPDRFSDAFIFIGAAYSVPAICMDAGTWLGGGRARRHYGLCARVGREHGRGTAFHRTNGQATTHGADDGRVYDRAFAPLFASLAKIIPAALALVVLGCVVTIFRRCGRIAREMESKR